MMTFSFLYNNPEKLAPAKILKGLDKATLEQIINREENNLKSMHGQFFGAITLCRLQLKLIGALKYLLILIANPNITLQELMRQLSKISSLYFEIHGELEKAKRHQDAIIQELQAQELKQQELLLLMYIAYETAIIEQFFNMRNEKRKKREHAGMDEKVQVKGLLENVRNGLSLLLNPFTYGLKFRPY